MLLLLAVMVGLELGAVLAGVVAGAALVMADAVVFRLGLAAGLPNGVGLGGGQVVGVGAAALVTLAALG